MPSTGERFERAVTIMARLRAPGGCPWDREQTFDSIKPYTLEETYEVFEAIDNRDWQELPGELGDLLFTVVNLGRHLNVDAEMALRGCNLRFRQRFRVMEQMAPRPLEELNPKELEELWSAAKSRLAQAHPEPEAHKEALP